MWETANILKISKSIKLLVKMKNVSFILQKKTKQTFWPTRYMYWHIVEALKMIASFQLQTPAGLTDNEATFMPSAHFCPWRVDVSLASLPLDLWNLNPRFRKSVVSWGPCFMV